MDASWTAEQDSLRAMLRELAADRAGSAQLRAAIDSPTGTDPALWALCGELGLLDLDSFLDAAVVLEEAGRALLPVPLLATLAAAQVRRSLGAAATPAPSMALAVPAGAAGAALGPVIDAASAGEILVAMPDALWLLPGPALAEASSPDAEASRPDTAGNASPPVRVIAAPPLDPTRPLAHLELGPDPTATLRRCGERIGDADAAARACDVLRVALAVESVGVARRCLELIVTHLRTREQFGRPLGAFQALAHRTADLAVAVEAAASTAYYAAWVVADSPEELAVTAALAKSVCADTAYRVAAETIQLHGGIGFTWEHDAHLLFKRATTTRALLGGPDAQRRLVAVRAGLADGSPAPHQAEVRGDH